MGRGAAVCLTAWALLAAGAVGCAGVEKKEGKVHEEVEVHASVRPIKKEKPEIIRAAEKGDVAEVKRLLAAGAKAVLGQRGVMSRMPLRVMSAGAMPRPRSLLARHGPMIRSLHPSCWLQDQIYCAL